MTLPSVGYVKTIPEESIFEEIGMDIEKDILLIDECFIDEYNLSYKEFLEAKEEREHLHNTEDQSLVDCLVLSKQKEIQFANESLNEEKHEMVNESSEELAKQEDSTEEQNENEAIEEQEKDSTKEQNENEAIEEQEKDSTKEQNENDVREEQKEDSTEEQNENEAIEEQEEDSTEEHNENDAREEQKEDSAEEHNEADAREEHELEKNTLETEKSDEKKEEDLESTLFWSASIQTFAEQPVNKLGHINRTATIYKELGKTETVSTNNLLHAVYYVKKQATYNGERYYELSRNWNGTGVVGWAKASDLSVRDHVLINRDQFDMQVKGTGNAYTKAWGGSQDLVSSLSGKQGTVFKINLTEQVGNHTWYRGTLDGQQVWIQSTHVEKPRIVEEATNKLGHINRTATIYKELGKTETVSTNNLLHAVYYVKKQATYNGERYYELSRNWNGTGVVGWAKASDLSVRDHVLINRDQFDMQVKGTGNAYTKAWGGSQDLVSSLSGKQGTVFKINLTERVGNHTWYRGTLDGQQVWIQSTHVEKPRIVEEATNKLGHINRTATIYKELGKTETVSTNNLLNAVYYVKKQATYNGERYYELSRNWNGTGVVGWGKASDLSVRDHVLVNRNATTMYAIGSGNAYSKAWGGSQDLVYNLSNRKGKQFLVNLTERVGNVTWHRGTLDGQQVWIRANHVTTDVVPIENHTRYNISLEEAVNRQFGPYAVTDTYTQYVSADHVSYSSANGGFYYVDTPVLNVRSGPGTAYAVVDQLVQGTRLSIRRSTNGWYQLMWVNAKKEDIAYYMNPFNFLDDARQRFQFLDLSKPSGASANVLNNYLTGKGTLSNQGQAFIDAGITHGVNDIYLLSHALLETGHGTSTLARGVEVNGTVVYNMYGIGARDHCPIECGSQYAYDQGWDTPYKAIVGGASFIGNSYIKSGQNTLYKMRWNPAGLVSNGRPTHQYATDIGWASKQVHTMYNLYQEIGSYSLTLDIPDYNG